MCVLNVVSRYGQKRLLNALNVYVDDGGGGGGGGGGGVRGGGVMYSSVLSP